LGRRYKINPDWPINESQSANENIQQISAQIQTLLLTNENEVENDTSECENKESKLENGIKVGIRK